METKEKLLKLKEEKYFKNKSIMNYYEYIIKNIDKTNEFLQKKFIEQPGFQGN
jgi:hypothetical protein